MLRTRSNHVFCVLGLAAFAGAAMAQPANDSCSSSSLAILGTTAFSNIDATTDGASDCGDGGGADIWFNFTAPANGTYTFDTCGADFDTILSLVPDCGAFEMACNDDSCGLNSSVSYPMFAGWTIFVRVAGYGGDMGSGELHISQAATLAWDETANGGGDAGETLVTAQVPQGSGDLTGISGSIDSGESTDMYKIRICDVAGFSATTDTANTGGEDTQLFLFDASGNGVEMDDDDPVGTGFTSYLDSTFVTTAGVYYIAVTHYNDDPLNASGAQIWSDTPFDVIRAPDGASNGGDITVASWENLADFSFPYGIAFTGVCYPSCPADFNGDTTVDFFDYLDFVNAFAANDPIADFNADGSIDFFDYLDFVNAFATGC